MRDIILIIILSWTISILIMRKQIFEEDVPLWVTILRLVLAPLLMIFEAVILMIIGIRSSLRD
jgi:hypothetical protein